jgi:hypothetical protein
MAKRPIDWQSKTHMRSSSGCLSGGANMKRARCSLDALVANAKRLSIQIARCPTNDADRLSKLNGKLDAVCATIMAESIHKNSSK